MNYSIVVLPTFAIKLKKLSKKYKKIKIDFQGLKEKLNDNPKSGIPLQYNCYKMRVSNSSIPAGKSGGFRVIYYFVNKDENIFLMTLFSKTQKENISDNELLELLKINGLDK
ncbi:MAG: type II toxin-antitoxin system RelE/ParE family toxin [Sulfurospirillum sp.]|nr:type II toxin-antitoxin system RelE/ParE family toxin [Sulfurospirillum sp.]MBL0702403.1 type II toxin-antitoxin system RelE/ParE family toxin [Sulfurospirillum sp.]